MSLENYFNDLPDNLTSNPKFFAEETPLFPTVTNPNATAGQINNYLINEFTNGK